MAGKSIVRKSSDIKAIDDALRSLHPSKKPDEIREIRAKIFSYLADGLKDRYNIALIKEGDGQTKLKILRLIEQPRGGRLLRDGHKKEEK